MTREIVYAEGAFEMVSPHIVSQGDPYRLRKKMVLDQLERRGITNPLVLLAMEKVPRHKFLPAAMMAHAYEDRSIPIGYGQTISQPFTVAKMLQWLEPEPGMRILEIGMGSGYQAAVLAEMGCTVYGIERLPQLYQTTRRRLSELGFRRVHPHLGDGTNGLAVAAPFERIIVAAGGPEVPPPLLEQLEEDGILLIPVGARPREQQLYRLKRKGSKFFAENLGQADFVNLVGEHGW